MALLTETFTGADGTVIESHLDCNNDGSFSTLTEDTFSGTSNWAMTTGTLTCEGNWGWTGKSNVLGSTVLLRCRTKTAQANNATVDLDYKCASWASGSYGANSSQDGTCIWLRYQTQWGSLYEVYIDKYDNNVAIKRKVPAIGYTGSTSLANNGVYYVLYTDSACPVVGAGQTYVSLTSLGSSNLVRNATDVTGAGGTAYHYKITITTLSTDVVQIQIFRDGVLLYSATDDHNNGIGNGGQTLAWDLANSNYDTSDSRWNATTMAHPIQVSGYSGMRVDNAQAWFDNFVISATTVPISLPAKVVGGYWETWETQTVAQVNSAYNLIYLSFLEPNGTSGAVQLQALSSPYTTATLKSDIAAKRAAGVTVLASMGGAGTASTTNVSFTTSGHVTAFVNSIVSLQSSIGPFDGIDIDLEDQAPLVSPSLVVSAMQQLKIIYPGFIVSYCAADSTWITNGPPVCTALNTAGVLDVVGIMNYDWPATTDAAKLADTTTATNYWSSLISGDWTRILLGFELYPSEAANLTMTPTLAVTAWNMVESAHPTIRGGFVWDTFDDSSQGNPFALDLAPLIVGVTEPPMIDASSLPSVKSDPTAVGSVTTTAFLPPSGSVLFASVLMDTVTSGDTITMSTVTGSTSAWTTVEAPTVTNGKVGIYWATVSSSVSTTVRATNNNATDMALKVYVLTGVNTSTPVGAHGHTLIAANPTTVSYTATAVGSMALIAEESYLGGAATISGTSSDGFLSSSSAGLLAHQTTPSTGLTTQSFVVAGVTNSPALAYAEVIPAGGGGGGGTASGAALALFATIAASGAVNGGVATGGYVLATATITAAGSVGGRAQSTMRYPEVVVNITNPPAGGGFTAAVVNDLYRTTPDGVTVRIAANLPPNAQFIDMLPGAGTNEYIAVAFSASGASSMSATGNTSAYADVYTDVYK